MKMPVIHQVLVGASEGDAITQMAFAIRDALRPFAHSDIYAWWRHGQLMQEECRDLNEFPASQDVDILIYHSSIGWEPVSKFLRSRSEKIVLSYHNITPSSIYKSSNPQFAADLDLGRQDLEFLRDRVVLALADSQYNASDLMNHGYSNIRVVPAGFQPRRLCDMQYDIGILNEMASKYPNGYIVAVGQVLPHKRIEQLIATVHLLNSTYWCNLGLVICGVARQLNYQNALSLYQHRCAMVNVHFAGQVSDQQLSTFIRGSLVYLGMSDHEGLSIPPVEAMAMGIPVVVKGAAAIPETVGDGALVLPDDAGPILTAEAIYEVIENKMLRWSLIDRGFQRCAELEARSFSEQTAKLLLEVSE